MPSHDAIREELLALELALLEPATRHAIRPSELLDEGFIEFGASGRIYTKSQALEILAHEIPVKRILSSFEVKCLTAEIALATYRLTLPGSSSGDSLRSSIWKREEGGWTLLFHQGTPTSSEKR